MKEFRPAKKRVTVSVGESVRIIRELQGLSQNQLAERTGIPQATLSALENDRVRLAAERHVRPQEHTHMWHTKQLIFHGAVVLLVGLLCGAPMGRSIVRGRPESVVRAWRVAHTSLVLGGVLLLALGGIVTYLALSPPALALL